MRAGLIEGLVRNVPQILAIRHVISGAAPRIEHDCAIAGFCAKQGAGKGKTLRATSNDCLAISHQVHAVKMRGQCHAFKTQSKHVSLAKGKPKACRREFASGLSRLSGRNRNGRGTGQQSEAVPIPKCLHQKRTMYDFQQSLARPQTAVMASPVAARQAAARPVIRQIRQRRLPKVDCTAFALSIDRTGP